MVQEVGSLAMESRLFTATAFEQCLTVTH